MTPRDRLVVGQVGISREHAKHLLAEHRVEKLPIVDENDHLTGLITVKDFVKTEQYPNATKDSRGRLVVGAAVGYWGDTWERATALAEAGVDVLVVDTANGGAQLALDMIRRIKADPTFEGIDIIGGNVATTEGAQALIPASASPRSPPSTWPPRPAAPPESRSSRTAACSTRATSARPSWPAPTPSCSAPCWPAARSPPVRSCSPTASSSSATAAWARSAR